MQSGWLRACIPSSVAGREVRWHPVMDPNVAVMGAMPRTGIHPQRQKIFLARGFPAAPGMPRADPSVLGTVASGKNVWFKIGQCAQRYFFCCCSCRQKAKITTPSPIWNRPQGGRDKYIFDSNIVYFISRDIEYEIHPLGQLPRPIECYIKNITLVPQTTLLNWNVSLFPQLRNLSKFLKYETIVFVTRRK